MKPLPLRTSLTSIYTGLLAVLVTSVALGYHQLLVRQVDRDATATLEETVRALHGYLQLRADRPVLVFDERDPDETAFIEEATRYYQIFDETTGQLVAQSRGLEARGLTYTPAEVTQFSQSRGLHDVETDRGRLRIASTSITLAPGREFLLQVGLPLGRFDRSVANLEHWLFWGIGIGLIASALVGRWMAARALVPLSRLAQATRHIDIHTLHERLPVRGASDELDAVSEAFNRALERLQHAVSDMRQFSAALAHELRTPLAILRGETELALTKTRTLDEVRGRLEGQLEEFDRLNGLITQLLTLARAESGQIEVARAELDLSTLVETTVEQLEPVAEARGITVARAVTEGITTTGDAGWLQRLLLILLDNAIKYTPDGGRIRVSMTRQDATALLAVADTGAGMPADVVPHVFEHFYRADAARSRRTEGAGLGLALAKWIAEQHHATIAVTSQQGVGSTFTVRIPVRAGFPTGVRSRPATGRDSGDA